MFDICVMGSWDWVDQDTAPDLATAKDKAAKLARSANKVVAVCEGSRVLLIFSAGDGRQTWANGSLSIRHG